MRQIILDTETTGLSSVSDRIIEIACIELENHLPTGKKFHAFVNPCMDISDGAYQTHGITKEFLNDKPQFSEIANALIAFIKDHRLVIHNADFDVGFLDAEFKIASSTYPSISEICEIKDTLAIARDKFPGQRNSLDALSKRFDINLSLIHI